MLLPQSRNHLRWAGVLLAQLIVCGKYLDAVNITGVCNGQKIRHLGLRNKTAQKYCGKPIGAKLRFLGKVFEDFAPPLRGRFTMGKNSIVVIWTV